MTRPARTRLSLDWLLAVAMTLFVLAGLLCSPGCAALTAATPLLQPLLATAERVLVDELDAARARSDAAARQREIEHALALLEECRRAHVAAEDAARRATEAAVLAHDAAEMAARDREAAETALAEVKQRELRAAVRRLGLAPKIAALAAAPEAP